MEIPQGYLLKRKGPVSVLLLEGAEWDVEKAGLFDSHDPLNWKGAVDEIRGGRAGLVRVRLESSQQIVVKPLLRGGWIRHINRALHFSMGRIFQEAQLSSHLIGKGIPVAPVVLGRAEARGFGLYRLHLGTMEIENRGTLFDLLSRARAGDAAKTDRHIMFEAGSTVRCLHNAGVSHPDLNLGNLLVTSGDAGGDDPGIAILDLDRAALNGSLAEKARHANIVRLLRHAVKNRLHETPEFKPLWTAFIKGYCRGGEDAAALEAEVERRFGRSHFFHRLSWALQAR